MVMRKLFQRSKGEKRWGIKAKNTIHVLFVTVEDEFLYRIKDWKTPNDVWGILETLFTKNNEAKLQQLENELISIKQGGMTGSQYFTKVKSLRDEIQEIDAESAINEARMCRIIFRDLVPKLVALS